MIDEVRNWLLLAIAFVTLFFTASNYVRDRRARQATLVLWIESHYRGGFFEAVLEIHNDGSQALIIQRLDGLHGCRLVVDEVSQAALTLYSGTTPPAMAVSLPLSLSVPAGGVRKQRLVLAWPKQARLPSRLALRVQFAGLPWWALRRSRVVRAGVPPSHEAT